MLETKNISLIKAFAKNINTVGSSRDLGNLFATRLEEIVLSRVASSKFLGGSWDEKPYSDNPIKAYKLGHARVSGKGMGKTLTIGGKQITDSDWYWGRRDWERKGSPMGHSAYAPRSFHTPSRTGKPTPVFIPGYKGWKVQYNGGSPDVDLRFTGSMLNRFNVDLAKSRGSNQYGDTYIMRFMVDQPYTKRAGITDFYRNWLGVSEAEIDEVMGEVGSEFINILFKE